MKILFLIVHPLDFKVIHYCHNILELFRLREVYKTHGYDVYRYTSTNKTFDLYAKFNSDKLWWDICSQGIGFERITYDSLEANWKFICQIRKSRTTE